MAINRLEARHLRQVASFRSSGTFVVPTGVTELYVTVAGATGTQNQSNQAGGAGAIISGYVSTAPGATHPVIIGAKGTDGNAARYTGSQGNQSGTTLFDGALIAAGGSNGGGTTGATYFDTAQPPLYPASAAVRVTSSSTANSTNFNTYNSGSGQVWIYC